MTPADSQSSTPWRVTVVVVTYNSSTVLNGLLNSMPDGLHGVPYELVVVDNDSRDDSVGIVEAMRPDATIVRMSSNRGYAAAINAAVRAARPSSAILVLNDDIRLSSGAVAALTAELTGQAVGVAVPKLLDGDGRLLPSQRRNPSIRSVFAEAILGGKRADKFIESSEVISSAHRYESSTDVDWASGCAWLIRRDVWDRVGEWDETYFLYAEDLDYAQRVDDAGFRMRYTPRAEVVHLVGPSHEDPRLWAMSMWNRYRNFRRRHSKLRALMFRSGLILNEAIRALPSGSVHRAGLAALVARSQRPREVRGP